MSSTFIDIPLTSPPPPPPSSPRSLPSPSQFFLNITKTNENGPHRAQRPQRNCSGRCLVLLSFSRGATTPTYWYTGFIGPAIFWAYSARRHGYTRVLTLPTMSDLSTNAVYWKAGVDSPVLSRSWRTRLLKQANRYALWSNHRISNCSSFLYVLCVPAPLLQLSWPAPPLPGWTSRPGKPPYRPTKNYKIIPSNMPQTNVFSFLTNPI